MGPTNKVYEIFYILIIAIHYFIKIKKNGYILK